MVASHVVVPHEIVVLMGPPLLEPLTVPELLPTDPLEFPVPELEPTVLPDDDAAPLLLPCDPPSGPSLLLPELEPIVPLDEPTLPLPVPTPLVSPKSSSARPPHARGESGKTAESANERPTPTPIDE